MHVVNDAGIDIKLVNTNDLLSCSI